MGCGDAYPQQNHRFVVNIRGEKVILRAVEPRDVELMYRWENDPEVWAVSGTLAPFSAHQLMRFVEEQQYDLHESRQMRLIIETSSGEAVGALDLFELDLLHRRAGVGVLIYAPEERRQGYASDAVETFARYGREVLGLHQLWCNVGADNAASRALFARCGFTETGRKHDWLWRPDGWHDELLLQRIL